jgi:lipoprotein signal peptidase
VKTAALAVAGADLVDKLLQPTPPELFHPRSASYVAVVAVLALALAWFVWRVRSRALSVAAGVAVGGALANAVSAVAWSGGVPDPLVAGGFAFNLADLFALAGVAALIVVAASLALTSRS